MRIFIKNVLFEVHHFIGLVKYYHGLFCRIDSIIIADLLRIKPRIILQISFQILNILLEPYGLVLTLLILDTYPCMTDIDALLSTINQSSIAMRKSMEEVRRSHASQQVNDVLNT